MKLTDIKEVKYTLQVGEEVRSYDPWETVEKMDKYAKEHGNVEWVAFDAVRHAFGFPLQAEVDAVTEGEKPFTLSRHQALEIQADLGTFIQNLPVTKKNLSLMRS